MKTNEAMYQFKSSFTTNTECYFHTYYIIIVDINEENEEVPVDVPVEVPVWWSTRVHCLKLISRNYHENSFTFVALALF